MAFSGFLGVVQKLFHAIVLADKFVHLMLKEVFKLLSYFLFLVLDDVFVHRFSRYCLISYLRRCVHSILEEIFTSRFATRSLYQCCQL